MSRFMRKFAMLLLLEAINISCLESTKVPKFCLPAFN